MSGMSGMGASWRHLRTDRSAVSTKVDRVVVRRVLGAARPHRRVLGWFGGVTVLDALLVVVTPLLVQRLVDDGIVAGDLRVVGVVAGLMALTAVVDAVLGVLGGWLSARLGEGLIYDLRRQVFAHVQRQGLAFFTRTQTGALVSRLNNDVVGAQKAFTSVLSSAVSNTVAVVVVGITMVALSWQVTLLCLLMFPLLFGVSRWVGARLAGLTRRQMDGNADLGNMMTERFNVGGAMLLKLFGRRPEEDALFAGKAEVVRGLGVRIALLTRLFAAAMMLVPAMATALVYGVGGYLVVRGELTLGTLLALATLLLRLLGPLQGLSNVRVDVMTALVSFERVFEVLDLPASVPERADAVPLPRHEGAGGIRLELDHVSFAYPNAAGTTLASLETVSSPDRNGGGQVLHDVTFVAEAGEKVALVGPSGAGKTTITHLVARLYDVDAGTVRLAGHDVRSVTLDSLEDAVGYVTQDAHLFHDTIGANLRYARPSATDPEIWAALDAARVGDLVRSLPSGLDTVVGDRGYRLSGGERQRLAIARLLLKAPPLVVLDEATAHLDGGSEQAVQEALATALEGRTSLVIAHRLSTVRDAEQILVVDGGRIVESGTHTELLLRDGLYARLHATQLVDDVTPTVA
ncbi:ABC transporter ATP-binding protein [Nocardioides zeae]|nr:ABC transporter ATP-binding protein [Nocardioides zeae]MDR6176268.1 ATP-binding cassette subfamily B protein [Nocardioides zeae]